MCRRVELWLEPVLSAAAEARAFTAETCRRWDLDAVSDVLVLAVSELVSNGVLHAHTRMKLILALGHGTVQVAVTDHGSGRPVLRPPGDLLAALAGSAGPQVGGAHHPGRRGDGPGRHAGGLGLVIVDAVSHEWGVSVHETGKDVWLRLHAPEGWRRRYARSCPCDQPAAGSTPWPGIRHVPGPWDAGPAAGEAHGRWRRRHSPTLAGSGKPTE
jgi:hypothetical protein